MSSKQQILKNLFSLSPADHREIHHELPELDSEMWADHAEPLTENEKMILETRLEAAQDTGASWEEVEIRLRERLLG